MLIKQPASLGVYNPSSVYSFDDILRVALAHDISPFGFNCTGGLHPHSDDLEAEWQADQEALVDQVNRAAALLRGVPATLRLAVDPSAAAETAKVRRLAMRRFAPASRLRGVLQRKCT